MKKTCLSAALLSFAFVMTASSQTLFTYGNHAVDVKDFLKAYTKNNTLPVANRAKSLTDYLDLYINSKLKIREALERRYDTLPQIKTEVANIRAQIAENYMADPEVAERLVREAFQRSQKDIKAAHIFISFKNTAGIADTVAAQTKRDEIEKRLKKGDDFSLVAEQSSDDPAAKNNKGDLGYITVFTLPYPFENAIYAAPAGKYTAPVRSKAGYHIFKNIAERKAVGKIKVQQILLAIPPGAGEPAKKQIAGLADSLYKLILKGENFGTLAKTFSADYISAANSGMLPDISTGQYDPSFENAIYSLSKDGAVSQPFQTSHGWHIVKRISLAPVVTDFEDKDNRWELRQKIMTDSRWYTSHEFIYKKVTDKAGYKKFNYDDDALWALSDSVLDSKLVKETGRSITTATPLFSIGDSVYHLTDWVNYANASRFRQDGTGVKPYNQLREEWVHFAMTNYYKDHLEDFNDEFRSQMDEFKDGNLFFEIMQQEIWNKAQTDTAALLDLYNKNKKEYAWKQSADAITFFSSDPGSTKVVYDEIKKNPSGWKKLISSYAEKVMTDSSRYEWGQIPGLKNMQPKAGMITDPVFNKMDNTTSFAYIIQVYPLPAQRTFDEAKGLVINDYQALLEQQWNQALRKKYPVVINQEALKGISR